MQVVWVRRVQDGETAHTASPTLQPTDGSTVCLVNAFDLHESTLEFLENSLEHVRGVSLLDEKSVLHGTVQDCG